MSRPCTPHADVQPLAHTSRHPPRKPSTRRKLTCPCDAATLSPPLPHQIESLSALEATHPDAAAAGHPAPATGPVPGSHDPSGAPSIRENLAYDKTRTGGQPE